MFLVGMTPLPDRGTWPAFYSPSNPGLSNSCSKPQTERVKSHSMSRRRECARAQSLGPECYFEAVRKAYRKVVSYRGAYEAQP
jgi:hypothetical protein